MILEKKLKRLEGIVEKANDKADNSLKGKTKRAFYKFYAVDIGGALLPRYQRPTAERLGWKEKNLTIANALIFGIGTSLVHSLMIHFGIGEVDKSLEDSFYIYPQLNTLQSILRFGYAQLTNRSCPSVGLVSLVNIPYFVSELVKSRRSKNQKPVEHILSR